MAGIEASDRDKVLELARRDFAYFVRLVTGWQLPPHQQTLCQRLQEIEQEPDARQCVAIAPSAGKTDLLTLFAVWCLGRWSEGRGTIERVAYASYGERLPKSVSQQARRYIASNERVAAIWPRLVLETEAVLEWRLVGNTKKDPSFFATSTGGASTGYHFDLLVIDDSVKNLADASSDLSREDLTNWFEYVWLTRVDPGSRFVIAQTRWREDDLIGYATKHQSQPWQSLSFPAIVETGDGTQSSYWPERYSLEELQSKREAIGSAAFSALYQQQPVPAEGNVFSRSWLDWYEVAPTDLALVVCSVDTALKAGEKSDYTAMVRLGIDRRGHYYVLDLLRKRLPFTTLIQQIESFGRPEELVLVEDTAAGSAAIDALKKYSGRSILASKPASKSKQDRALSVSPLFESGKVHLPATHHLAGQLEHELLSFPAGEYDDLVDALVYGLGYLRRKLAKASVGASADQMLAASIYGAL